ncbi:hypothetical protein SALBM311S_12320 [Streptomyces alboniger]
MIDHGAPTAGADLMTAVLSHARYSAVSRSQRGRERHDRRCPSTGGRTTGPAVTVLSRSGTARRRCRSSPNSVSYGAHLMFGFTWPVQLKMAMLSQPFPLLVMSAGSHPLPVTAYQVGSQ